MKATPVPKYCVISVAFGGAASQPAPNDRCLGRLRCPRRSARRASSVPWAWPSVREHLMTTCAKPFRSADDVAICVDLDQRHVDQVRGPSIERGDLSSALAFTSAQVGMCCERPVVAAARRHLPVWVAPAWLTWSSSRPVEWIFGAWPASARFRTPAGTPDATDARSRSGSDRPTRRHRVLDSACRRRPTCRRSHRRRADAHDQWFARVSTMKLFAPGAVL